MLKFLILIFLFLAQAEDGMSLNSTPNSERFTIGLFGNINAGKSSLINALTGEKISIVSSTPGTTTDPVSKAMEMLPIGPILFIDTPGIDDSGELGSKRVLSAKKSLRRCDLVILVIDIGTMDDRKDIDSDFLDMIHHENIPVIIVYNKSDKSLYGKFELKDNNKYSFPVVFTDAVSGKGIPELKSLITSSWKKYYKESTTRLTAGIVKPGDLAVLVTPIDESAPKGRLILPQQITIREILDIGASALVTKETELNSSLKLLSRSPDIVITDSKVFKEVSSIIPKDVPLTSFSILFARIKGDLDLYIDGINAINSLTKGDKVLISEACTHKRQCNDIGKVKIPLLLSKITDDLDLKWTNGRDFDDDLSSYKLIIHCGACMLNRREMQARIKVAKNHNVPITNYGILLAYMSGILPRAIEPFFT